MIERFLFWLLPIVCWVLPSYTIGRQGAKIYNRRYTLVPRFIAQRFGRDAVYIHHFQSSDPTTHMHNHPYDGESYSKILAGGYFEQRQVPIEGDIRSLTGERVMFYAVHWYRRGDRNVLTPDIFHRIDLIDEERGCWTLFVAGKKHNRGWGFLDTTTGKFTPWSGKDPSVAYEGDAR